MKLYPQFLIIIFSVLTSFSIGSMASAVVEAKKTVISPWQKRPLSFYQANEKNLLLDVSGFFEGGSLKAATAQETDKIENFSGQVITEYGLLENFSAKVQAGYISGKQKNSQSTTTQQGFKDIGMSVKYLFEVPLVFILEGGVETSPEALKVDSIARTINASSGGTKLLFKLGALLPSSENYVYGVSAYYSHFLQRDMDLTSALGTENLKVEGGDQFGVLGFYEYGSSLRMGAELKWNFQSKSTISSVYSSMSEFELESQKVELGAYLKIPINDKMLTYLQGHYALNPTKKRSNDSYDQDELYGFKLGVQSLF